MQERQYPPSASERTISTPRRPLRRRLAPHLHWVGAAALALFSAGCPEPADLQDPGSFPTPPGSGTAGSTATAGTGTGGTPGGGDSNACEVQCVTDIIKSNTGCGICHANGAMLGKLNLDPPYTPKLKDVLATHDSALPNPADCPTGDKLIDTADPSKSWLLIKLKNMQKGCGSVMPQTAPLSAAQMTCMETYISCVAGKAPAATGGTAAGGTATAGSSGTTTGGGGGTGGT